MWLLVIGQASVRCANDATCSQPDITPWLAIGVVILCSGILVGLVSHRRMNPRRPELNHRT
jgi:formate-dependent nitrite reductase membrane component NrfD